MLYHLSDTILAICFSPLLHVHFASFAFVLPLSLELKGSTATPQHFDGTGNMTMADTTGMMAKGTTTMGNTLTTVTGGMTMADVTTIATAGTTMLPHVGDGSSGSNVAPAIPNSITAQGQGPISFPEECAVILSDCTDPATAFAMEAVANAQDFNNAHASIVAKHRKIFIQCAFGIKRDGTAITNLSIVPKN